MKKVKIMLMVIAVMAICGATLAFKTKYNTEYCTTRAFYNPFSQTYYCPSTLLCPSLVTVVADSHNPIIPTICYTPAFEGTCIDEGVTLTCSTTSQPITEP